MRNLQRPGRSPVMASNAMIATSHPLASQVGIDIMKSGGNAVDAAIAACATLCVVEPAMTGIGGDCFALYSPAGSTVPLALNGSGRAPKAASVDGIRAQGISKIEVQSAHAVTVPGAIAAWTKLNADHGHKSMEELLAPAINYAQNGFPVMHRVGIDWAGLKTKLLADDIASKVLLQNGEAPQIGTTFSQPLLAETLKTISREGRDGFYKGAIAEDIVNRLKELGGFHTLNDFDECEVEYVSPINAQYRGHEVHECPPNGQGICALMILNILSRHNISKMDEVNKIHLLAEATKLAYHQRNLYVSDPNFSQIPVDWLLSEAHTNELNRMIDLDTARTPQSLDFPSHEDTTYLCCVDTGGNAISLINSLFSGFGSGIMAPKSGVILQNRGSSFLIDDTHTNRIEGGKRPMHTIIPGMITKNDKTIAPFGVMGGQYQAAGHAYVLSQMIDFGLSPQQALDFPRVFPNNNILDFENKFDKDVIDDLALRGHEINHPAPPIGGGQMILIDNDRDVLIGASDWRKDGLAIGY